MSLVERLFGKPSSELGETIDWTKVLCLVGGTVAAGGLLWYLLHDDGEEAAVDEDGADGIFYHVCDPRGAFIGIRAGPDTNSDRTGLQLQPGEIFEVEETVKQEDQTYLKLADGRGWAFTHSSRDGRMLCERLSAKEARSKMAEMPRPQSQEALQALMERTMRERPELQQLLSDPEVQANMGNPEAMAKYFQAIEAAMVGQMPPQGR
eukprot:g17555.t1